MNIGIMNNPATDPAAEVRWAASHGFEAIDITVEGPRATREALRGPEFRNVLANSGLAVVGHLGWYYPLDLPSDEVRRGIVDSLMADIEVLAELGAPTATVHLTMMAPGRMFTADERVAFSVALLREVIRRCEPLGVRPVIEHVRGDDGHLAMLDALLEQLPQLGFHLDVGHANLGARANATFRLLQRWGSRLHHVHMSDNFGHDDLHLPLGAGNIDWPAVVNNLKACRYDRAITLEVFSNDRDYVQISRDKLLNWWR